MRGLFFVRLVVWSLSWYLWVMLTDYDKACLLYSISREDFDIHCMNGDLVLALPRDFTITVGERVIVSRYKEVLLDVAAPDALRKLARTICRWHWLLFVIRRLGLIKQLVSLLMVLFKRS